MISRVYITTKTPRDWQNRDPARVYSYMGQEIATALKWNSDKWQPFSLIDFKMQTASWSIKKMPHSDWGHFKASDKRPGLPPGRASKYARYIAVSLFEVLTIYSTSTGMENIVRFVENFEISLNTGSLNPEASVHRWPVDRSVFWECRLGRGEGGGVLWIFLGEGVPLGLWYPYRIQQQQQQFIQYSHMYTWHYRLNRAI